MKKTLCLFILFILCPTFLYAQTEAITNDGRKVTLNSDGTWIYSDCAALLKANKLDGEVYYVSKENIILENADSGLDITLFQSTKSVSMVIAPANRDIICVDKGTPANIEFTDGTAIKVTHMIKLNCEGKFFTSFGEIINTGNELELLKTKLIKKIVIEYPKVKADKNYTVQTIVPADKAQKIMNTIRCLSEI